MIGNRRVFTKPKFGRNVLIVNVWIAVVIGLLTNAWAWGIELGDMPSASDSAAKESVLAFEQRRCAAMIAGDIRTLEYLLADDLIYVHASSRIDDKASFLAQIKSGALKFERILRDDVTVRVCNFTSAIITGRARVFVNSKGESKEIHIRFTNVWVRSDAQSDDWRFTTWQATKIPPVDG